MTMVENKLYAFGKLCKSLGIPEKGEVYTTITHELTIEEQLNNIEFTEEGVVYTDPKGNEWLGYVYKKHKALGKGGKDDYPRMHLYNCGATKTWGEESYIFSNTIPIECCNTDENDKIRVLPNIMMCKNCIPCRRNIGWRNYRDAKQYVNYIRANYDLKDSRTVNHWGFTKYWEAIRKKTIEERNCRCERCGEVLDSVAGRVFLHVYHKDRDMANNDKINLECLCTRCFYNSQGIEKTDALKKHLYGYLVYIGEEAWKEEHKPLSDLTEKQRKMFPNLFSAIMKEAYRLIKHKKYWVGDAVEEAMVIHCKGFSSRDFEYLSKQLPNQRWTDNNKRMSLQEWYEYYRKPKYVERDLFDF